MKMPTNVHLRTHARLSVLKGPLAAVRRRYPDVKGAYVFGSFASGAAKPRDIDAMLLFDAPAMLKAERSNMAGMNIGSKKAFNHLRRRVISAQELFWDLVEKKTGLEVGVNFPKGRGAVNMGCMFFDLSNSEAALGSLSEVRSFFRGLPASGHRRGKPPFELRQQHFVGTKREVVRHFVNRWNELKRLEGNTYSVN